MTLTEIAELIAMLKTRWPRATWASDSVLEAKMWHMTIGDISLRHVQQVLPSLVQSSEFPPDPAAIRSAVLEASGVGPLPEAAWGEVQSWLRKAIDFNDLPVPIKQAIYDIGGTYNVRNSQRPDQDRRAFMDAYTIRRNATMTSPQFSEMVGAGFPALGRGE